MEIKLLYSTPLWLIANAIRYSHNNHNKSDSFPINHNIEHSSCVFCKNNISINEEGFIYCLNCNKSVLCNKHIGYKDFDLIKRIGFHMNHSSTLEHSLLIFHVKLSTKALLEWTRSRIGVAYTVTSSRYALDSIGINMEQTEDEKIDKLLKEYSEKIKNLLIGSKKSDFDKLAMLLPQSFLYKMQVSFNLRSLVHFLELRTHKSAHITIRKLAIKILDELKIKEPLYFELLMENEKIKTNYKNFKKDLKNDCFIIN